MAKTLFFGKVPKGMGIGMKMAMGTIYDGVSHLSSFAVYTDAAGSKVMRNILTAIVQPMAGSSYCHATGSSDGYITINLYPAGTPIPTGGTGTLPANFIAFGGYGSI